MKKAIIISLVVMLTLFAFVGCGKSSSSIPVAETTAAPAEEVKTETAVVEEAKTLEYADGTVLRMATGYNNKKTGLTYDASVVGEGITLGGVTYHSGDFKPTWVEVQNILNVKLEDKYQGNSAANELKYWKERLADVDIIMGGSTTLNEYGEAGSFVNLAEYLDYMPNFKAYLEANPIVRLSITGNTSTGAIYFAPYFDGVNDIERMPLMRVDMLEKLLDGEGKFTAAKSGKLTVAEYEPFMPTSGKVSIETPTSDASGTFTLTKNYDKAGNIVEKMNAAIKKGGLSGVDAVNMLRNYIDAAYDGYYGTKRSNLFAGQDAAWDADEMVALLRCVVANAYTLNGTDSIQGLFSREDANLSRQSDMIRFASTLFGIRGLESRQDFLYFDADGNLRDARQDEKTYEAINRMRDLALEGLISKSFIDGSNEKSSTIIENDIGFMSYDYNQTQTIFNNDGKLSEGEVYRAAMVPVSRWFDGTDPNGVYMRFTESWRSVKTTGWAISKAGVEGNADKLNAALALLDFAYSERGQILLSYGPDVFIKTNADGSYVTFNFNGKEMPVIADETKAKLWELAGGNYTNFARQYLGSTLHFVKSQAFEFQCTTDAGMEGAGYISKAIALGTIKHPELAVAKNMWYTSIPTTLPTTTVETSTIQGYTELTTMFSTTKGEYSVLVDMIQKGYTLDGVSSEADMVNKVANEWGGKQYLKIKGAQWTRLLKFYEGL
ncbi:MAG: hypothetical protein K6F82_00340 [Sphaerochaetaceae bacterium]|nr:hypothetical protein [Sphaerochaetaceae bacterium]